MSKFRLIILLCVLFLGSFILLTLISINNPAQEFQEVYLQAKKPQILDRNNIPLNITFENEWNLHGFIKLEKVPSFLQQAFLLSEDKRFYDHKGVDWIARLSALKGNIFGKNTRGASTITEQVVQMIHPKRRNLWSKWIEGWEAKLLEKKASKSQIFEFYLNQVPYSKRNRGIIQGANYYFDHDISLLNKKSMLALALIIRAPNRLDLHKKPLSMQKSFLPLLHKLHKSQVINEDELNNIAAQELKLNLSEGKYNYSHFTKYIISNFVKEDDVKITTTLDINLQNSTQEVLNKHLKDLDKYNVNNAAVIILNNKNNDVVSWVVANNKDSNTNFYNTIVTKRQPGSTLKPFLYALDIELGSNAASIIDDSKMEQSVGMGVHQLSNYSNTYYGKITLRQALANSLNIPAIKTVDKIGVENFLNLLHKLHFDSLDKSASFYGTGLSLGNGEVTLFELVRAFSVFTNHGTLKEPNFILNKDGKSKDINIFKSTTTSVISNILSDKVARSLEFSDDIYFSSQTAFKTGTSSDFKDAWVVGYNANYLVGIWLGNLNNETMDGVTGSIGALPILQDIISLVDTKSDPASLYTNRALIKKDICVENGIVTTNKKCNSYTEFFAKDIEFAQKLPNKNTTQFKSEIIFPTNGLIIAIDPKTPKNTQVLKINITDLKKTDLIKIYR
jgi:penicillin-binding protein 1C